MSELTSTLKLSSEMNASVVSMKIGSVFNKNLQIRNLTLLRNIGKYPLYDIPMTPEIGMLYNPYEHLLNRPVQHYSVANPAWKPNTGDTLNGLLEWNNNITENLGGNNELVSPWKDLGYWLKKTFTGSKFVKEVEPEEIANPFRLVEDRDGLKKLVYVSNSGSMGLEGGNNTLKNTKLTINEYLQQKQITPYLINDKEELVKSGLSIDNIEYNVDNIDESINGIGLFVTKDDENRVFLNTKLNGYLEQDSHENLFDREKFGEQYISNSFVEIYENDVENTPNSLLAKTNTLFKEGKIHSLINRFQTNDTNNVRFNGLSRGRALLKKESDDGTPAKADGIGYNNPWCRVWTLTHQYNTMKDLIRPRLSFDDEKRSKFATIEEIQSKYAKEMRPNNGAQRLNDSSVLYSNGFVNISPFYNPDNNELNIDSIKRCMFSIENLAWKDEIPSPLNPATDDEWLEEDGTKRNWFYNNGKPRLSKEQQGPNGGRIMWFPPYDLKFSEQVSTTWNSNSFIGRGENIYTYTNTERGGTLSFTMLIDHPSVVDNWRGASIETSGEEGKKNESDILRFFAGCDDLGEEGAKQNNKGKETRVIKEPVLEQDPKPDKEKASIKFFVFFPNNYSGCDDTPQSFIEYMMFARDCNCPYEMLDKGQALFNSTINGGTMNLYKWQNHVDKDRQKENLLYYIRDGKFYYWDSKNGKEVENTETRYASNLDMDGYGLNSFSTDKSTMGLQGIQNILGLDKEKYKRGDNLFAFEEMAEAIDKTYGDMIHASKKENVDKIKYIFNEFGKNIKSIKVAGVATSHGNNLEENINVQRNNSLALRRAETVRKWLQNSIEIENINYEDVSVMTVKMDNQDVSSLQAKLTRSAEVTIEFDTTGEGDNAYAIMSDDTTTLGNIKAPVEKENETDKPIDPSKNTEYFEWNDDEKGEAFYDQEYKYFKHIAEEDSFIHTKIIEKIKYFDPAFHSITPEGFNGRLNFLQQCTRQGPSYAKTKNLAFGRAPYCVLKIGDFYNTKIVIENVNVDYNENQWDLNPEGVGVQPMMAKIDINFKFIGGSDLSGPIDRLQNAVSFNYYANSSVYDGRAIVNNNKDYWVTNDNSE